MAKGEITRLTMHRRKTTPEERKQMRAMNERWQKELAEMERNATPRQRELMRRLDEDPEMERPMEMIVEATRK
jgi:hypothetical protein